MATGQVPKDIREFVAGHLPSIEHLEAFILLHKNWTRSWSSPEVAAELHIPESTAEAVLERLASHNFLDVKISNEIIFRFNPMSSDLKAMAARCADCYVRERIAVINLVTTSTLTSLQDFADAFRLKKDKGNA